MRTIIYLSIISVVIWSCEPMDDRLHIVNHTKSDIYVAYLIVSKGKIIEDKRTVKILRKEDKTIGIRSNWDAKLQKNDGKKLKVIIYYTNFELLENHYKITSSSIIIDSLYDIGECKYREYSYEELEKKNWRVIYPDDKFSSVLAISKMFFESTNKSKQQGH